MKRLAGVLCAVLGVILLIGGYVAFLYEVWLKYPYRYLAFPLIVLGVILIKISGVFRYFYTPKETP